MKKRTKKKGFTLIELIVVIAILGVLAAIAIPRFQDVTQNSRKRAHNSNVSILESAAQLYIADHPGTAVTAADSATTLASYVKTWPTVPSGTGDASITGNYTVAIGTDGTVTVAPAAVAMP